MLGWIVVATGGAAFGAGAELAQATAYNATTVNSNVLRTAHPLASVAVSLAGSGQLDFHVDR
jgi:hypothetical protein